MIAVLLIIHLFVTLALIGVVLIQRSEGGGLGIGSSQGMGAFMSGRGTANLLTRTTAVLAATFFGLSLTLALLNKGTSVQRSVLDVQRPAQHRRRRCRPRPATSCPVAPLLAPGAACAPACPAAPACPLRPAAPAPAARSAPQPPTR